MYIQTLIRNTDVITALTHRIRTAQAEGYRVLFAQADVQTHLFSSQEDVFVTLEVERARKE